MMAALFNPPLESRRLSDFVVFATTRPRCHVLFATVQYILLLRLL
jgi:hypothetical protein